MRIKMKFLVIILCAFCEMITGADIVSQLSVSNKVSNGLEISKVESSLEEIPFSQELIGGRYFIPSGAYSLQNYVNGSKEGSSVVFTPDEIIYIVTYQNEERGEVLSIYPDGIFSVSAEIKSNILNGQCTMRFQPYKYSFDSRATSVSNYDYIKIKIPKEAWILDREKNFAISTTGYYKNNQRYSGKFLRVIPEMDLRIVSILTYENYTLIEELPAQVFKLRPYVRMK